MKPVLLFALLLLALPAQAERPALYIEGAVGIDQHRDDSGIGGQRTLGQLTLGAEYDGIFLELQHLSDVQVEDEHGGYNVLWLGLRKRWQL